MNGYIAILMDGEKIGIKFGMPAIRQFGKNLKKFELITEGAYNELGIAHILYAGYCCNCQIKYEEPEIKFEKFYEFAEEALKNEERLGVIKDVVKCFEESQYVQEVVEKISKDNSTQVIKKKNGTKLKPSVTGSSDLHQTSTNA